MMNFKAYRFFLQMIFPQISNKKNKRNKNNKNKNLI